MTRTVAGGREAFAARDWAGAYDALASVAVDTLPADDVHRLAIAATLTGREEEAVDAWERAHRGFLEAERLADAVRSAFWLGVLLRRFGQHAPAMGWFGRAQRLIEDADADVVAGAYLRIPEGLGLLHDDPEAALERMREATRAGDDTGDRDLATLGRLGQGQALVALGRAAEAGALFDQAMVAVTAGDVSPVAAGIVYCGVIVSCQQVFDLRRAQEWTAQLSRWCAGQPGLQPYRGQCLVHRSEIMTVRGAWSEAMEEVEQACDHIARSPNDPVMGVARYQQAELLRLRGEFTRAEQAYRASNEWGHVVQPGLALLRLAQGRLDDADAAIRRVVAETEHDRVQRARVLEAFVRITLATGDVEAAAGATAELEQVAADLDAPYLSAVARSCRGAVALARDEASEATTALRGAWRAWQALEAPYEAARTRVLLARAYREVGDHDSAEMELDAARRVFEDLGATPDLDEVAQLARPAGDDDAPPGGLTPREAEVLRLVATGATNREVADTLVISEKTVARHLSNLYTKLGLSSRAAATAWAYEHGVVQPRAT